MEWVDGAMMNTMMIIVVGATLVVAHNGDQCHPSTTVAMYGIARVTITSPSATMIHVRPHRHQCAHRGRPQGIAPTIDGGAIPTPSMTMIYAARAQAAAYAASVARTCATWPSAWATISDSIISATAISPRVLW